MIEVVDNRVLFDWKAFGFYALVKMSEYKEMAVSLFDLLF